MDNVLHISSFGLMQLPPDGLGPKTIGGGGGTLLFIAFSPLEQRSAVRTSEVRTMTTVQLERAHEKVHCGAGLSLPPSPSLFN